MQVPSSTLGPRAAPRGFHTSPHSTVNEMVATNVELIARVLERDYMWRSRRNALFRARQDKRFILSAQRPQKYSRKYRTTAPFVGPLSQFYSSSFSQRSASGKQRSGSAQKMTRKLWLPPGVVYRQLPPALAESSHHRRQGVGRVGVLWPGRSGSLCG